MKGTDFRIVSGYPKKGVNFIDITPILNDKDLFSKCLRELEGILAYRFSCNDVDVIVGAESRGFIFGSALAAIMGVRFVPLRKRGKLPSATISGTYALEYGTDTLELHTDAIKKGDRVVFVDDILATGGTAECGLNLIERLGGVVKCCLFVCDIVDLEGKVKLENSGYEVYSMCRFTEKGLDELAKSEYKPEKLEGIEFHSDESELNYIREQINKIAEEHKQNSGESKDTEYSTDTNEKVKFIREQLDKIANDKRLKELETKFSEKLKASVEKAIREHLAKMEEQAERLKDAQKKAEADFDEKLKTEKIGVDKVDTTKADTTKADTTKADTTKADTTKADTKPMEDTEVKVTDKRGKQDVPKQLGDVFVDVLSDLYKEGMRVRDWAKNFKSGETLTKVEKKAVDLVEAVNNMTEKLVEKNRAFSVLPYVERKRIVDEKLSDLRKRIEESWNQSNEGSENDSDDKSE